MRSYKRVSLLTIHSIIYSFALRFLFLQTHTTSYVFLQTHAISYGFLQTHATPHIFIQFRYTVKEKVGKPDKNHTPFPMVSEIHTETSSLRNLNIMPSNLNNSVCS